MALLDATDAKLMEGWMQRREKVTELDWEYRPRWVVFSKKRWLVFESPYATEQALTSYSIPAISSLEYSRQVKEFSFSTPQSGRVDFRSDSSKSRDKWVFLLRDTIPQSKLEQTQEMMQRKAESQAAREFAEIQRNAAFNTILQAENLIMCMEGYRAYAQNLAQTLMQVVYFADVVLKEGMNAAKPLSETIMELVDRGNSAIAISRDKQVRAGLVMYSVKTCRQAAEVLTYAKTAALNEGDLREFVQATVDLKRIVHEFLEFLDRTSMLSDLDDSVDATSTTFGRWMDGLIQKRAVPALSYAGAHEATIAEEPQGMLLQRYHIAGAEAYAMPSAEEISVQGGALLAQMEGLSGLLASHGLDTSSQADNSAELNESALRVAYLLRSLVESSKIVCDMTPSLNKEVRDGNMLDSTLKLAAAVEQLLSSARPGRPLDPVQLQVLRQLIAQLAVAANVNPEVRKALSLAQQAVAVNTSTPSPDWLSDCPAPAPPPPGGSSSSSSSAPAPLPSRSNSSARPTPTSSAGGATARGGEEGKPTKPSAALLLVTQRVEQAAAALANIRSARTMMEEQSLTYEQVSALRKDKEKEKEKATGGAGGAGGDQSGAGDQVSIVDLPPQLLEDTRALAQDACELLRAATAAYKEARKAQKGNPGAEGAANPKFLVFAARLVIPAIKKLLRVSQQDDPEAVVAAARLLNYTLAQLASSARARLPASNPAAQRLAAATAAVQTDTKAIAATSLQPFSCSGAAAVPSAGGARPGGDSQAARSALVQGLEAQQALHELDSRLQALRALLAAVRQSPDAKSTKLSGRAKALEREYELQVQIARVETEIARTSSSS
ncbi:MAG: PH domain-containing protein [archaeon]|nr:PH domain-containing protein [archaeon]